ncbi:MAG: YggS family pyridoxal phosphate-dependent enzyme [Synergistaceae bacterium]|nr:YggS family pyridoxal phosphate-dependent enzyme [Synergistaceae bacterium]
MVIPETIAERVASIRESIAEAASISGRSINEISLVAVSKTRTVTEMIESQPFVDAFGENRVQEAFTKKSNAVWNKPWRLIGSLQKNKVRKALQIFDTIDSVNSIELALTLQRILDEKSDRILPILIEVNASEENSKTGISSDDVCCLVDTVLECNNLQLEGFMTMASFTQNEDHIRKSFAKMRHIAEMSRDRTGLPLPVLSMGMSSDFHLAILEGSTLVRIGTALFGMRV